jgi:hypothetical protein
MINVLNVKIDISYNLLINVHVYFILRNEIFYKIIIYRMF